MKISDLPNIITGFRIVLVFPIIWLIYQEDYRVTLILFIVAGISDAIDGFLARKFNWTSLIGSYLDPLADKMLLISLFILLTINGKTPAWLASIVVLRDIIILVGSISYYFMVKRSEGKPLIVSKINTLFQVLYVTTILAKLGDIPIPEIIINTLIIIVGITTSVSGLSYMFIWGKSLMMNRERKNNHLPS
jgi:cardiolipin synthase